MMKKRVISVLLTVVMSLSMVFSVSATTQEQITNAKAEQEAAEEDLAHAHNKITDLESKKSELENYLTDLNKQLTELDESLTGIQNQIDSKEVELDMLQAALGRAKEQETQQYNDMKLRIRYMYENANSSLLTTLLEAESLTEFLNRVDAISQISEYDRQQLDTYKETKRSIEQQESEISAEREALLALKAESEQKQAELSQLVQTTDSKIAEYTASISEAELSASNLQDKIEQQRSLLASLNAKAEAEKREAEEEARREAALKAEAERVEAEAKEENKKPSGSTSSSDTASKDESSSGSSDSSTDVSDSSSSESSTSSSDSSTESAAGEYLGTFKLTAYCKCSKCCGQWANGVTASGTIATAGRTVAMAGLPFGTKLLINGNVYVVEDRGTSYGHVDIFFNTHSEALAFGRQYADVYRLN